MALTDFIVNKFTKLRDRELLNIGVSKLPDRPTMTADELKEAFDYLAAVTAQNFNDAINYLIGSTGSRGVGAVDCYGESVSVQDALDNLVKLIGSQQIAAVIPDGGLQSGQIADGAVILEKLADESVSCEKLADGSVSREKLADGSVSREKLADGSVSREKLANGAADSYVIADGAVMSGKIANGAVILSKIADGAVVGDKIPDASIAGRKLVLGSVGTSLLANGGVTTEKLYPGAVTPGVLSQEVYNLFQISVIYNNPIQITFPGGRTIVIGRVARTPSFSMNIARYFVDIPSGMSVLFAHAQPEFVPLAWSVENCINKGYTVVDNQIRFDFRYTCSDDVKTGTHYLFYILVGSVG